MKYAIIRVNGNQYKVQENEEVLLDLNQEKSITPEVLMVVDGEKVEIGSPIVKKAKITLKFNEVKKGKKITVRKYKAKSRYRKTIGSRPKFSSYTVSKFS